MHHDVFDCVTHIEHCNKDTPNIFEDKVNKHHGTGNRGATYLFDGSVNETHDTATRKLQYHLFHENRVDKAHGTCDRIVLRAYSLSRA